MDVARVDVNEISLYLRVNKIILYKTRDKLFNVVFFIFSDFHDEPIARNATSCSSVNYARMWTPLWRIATSVADT